MGKPKNKPFVEKGLDGDLGLLRQLLGKLSERFRVENIL